MISAGPCNQSFGPFKDHEERRTSMKLCAAMGSPAVKEFTEGRRIGGTC